MDFHVAEFIADKANACESNSCGDTYPGGCAGLVERVFPYDHDYYKIIDDCRSDGAR